MENEEQHRDMALDNIKWVVQVMVVFYHILMMYNAEGITGGIGKITGLKVQYYDAYLYIVFPWFMSLMFIVSGVTSKRYLSSHSSLEFIKSRTIKLLIPSTIGILVFWFIQGYINMRIIGIYEDVRYAAKWFLYLVMCFNGIGVLWFLHILWIASVLLLAVLKCRSDWVGKIPTKVKYAMLPILILPVWGMAQVLNARILIPYRLGFYLFYFFVGYFLFSDEEFIKIIKKVFPVTLLTAIILCACFCIRYWGMSPMEAPANRSLLFAASSWVGCLAVIGGFCRYGNFSNSFTKWMSKRSFGLYICHYFAISSFALFVVKAGIISGKLAYIISVPVAFGGGLLISEIISRIPVVRLILLGVCGRKPSVISTTVEEPISNTEA